MGVFTRLDERQIEAALADYGLAPTAVAGVPEGSVNTWYRVETAGGRYFLRLDERDDLGAVDAELRLLDALAGMVVPRIVRSRDGRAVTSLAGKPCLVFEALHGTAHLARELSVVQLAALGRAVAAMHAVPVTEAMAPHRFHPQRVYEALYLPVRERVVAEHPDAGRLLDGVFARGWEAYAFRALPQAIVHGDLFADNVLYAGDAVVGVIDFEASGVGPRLFDLAVAVHALCFDGAARGFEVARARALVDGYRAGVTLTAGEVAAWPEMLRYAGARFLVTRLRDFEMRPGAREAGTWKDYREYVDHLRAVDAVAGLLR
jgi:homoserine kinase type II